MKKKITFSLGLLFIIFGVGALLTAATIRETTKVYNDLLKSHQIEELRHSLIQRILKVQSDLHTVNTPFSNHLDSIIENVEGLERAAQQCTGCHHRPEVEQRLDRLQLQIRDFKNALSFYITASANREKIDSLKMAATLLGNAMVAETEQMSFEARENVKIATGNAVGRIAGAKVLMMLVLVCSGLFGILVAVHLARSITHPISELVEATRRIAAGDLGYTLGHRYEEEFGELAGNFDSMSRSLKSGYEKLQQSEERYALAARGANDGLWDWDLRTDTIYFSPRWKSMLGYDEDELEGGAEDWLRLVHPDDRGRLAAKIAAHVEGRTSYLEDEHRTLHCDGSYRWMLVRGTAVRDDASTAHRMAGSQTEITERKLAEARLLHDAFHDALTGLPNRALFMDRLEHVLHTARRRRDYRFAVLFLDLDRFKYVNDSLGHMIGDQLLIAVGERLSREIRPNDTVARLGGDEFAILLEDLKDGEAVAVAQRIQNELPRLLNISGHEVFPAASIGIALSSPHYERPEELLRDADLAMYQAKANGKCRFEIYETSMYASTIRHLQVETDLHRAIERNEFRLDYQPIVSLQSNCIIGFEALIRWQHPTLGQVSPSEFIPLAEETGLISAIGQWVLREACSQASRWQRRYPSFPLAISVNLSSREFTPTLIDQLRTIFAEMGVAPATLRLEITEGTIMRHPESAARLLLELKELGVGLHIDDFGTGYSSLSYLHHFPIDTLKIDGSFIQKINVDKQNLEIVKTIVSLAKNLEMKIVAEGMETEEELNTVRELGCDLVQGYFFYRPLTPRDVEDLMAAEHQPGSCGIALQGG